jgi:hypothetical protein
MPQQFNSGDDAVLAERKSAHAMIAGRTQPARTLITLNNGWILSMVGAVHHLLKPNFSYRSSGHRYPAYCRTALAVDPLRSFVSVVREVLEVPEAASVRQ